MMGKVSKAAFDAGGEVIGIMPKFLSKKENISLNVTKNIIVKDFISIVLYVSF